MISWQVTGILPHLPATNYTPHGTGLGYTLPLGCFPPHHPDGVPSIRAKPASAQGAQAKQWVWCPALQLCQVPDRLHSGRFRTQVCTPWKLEVICHDFIQWLRNWFKLSRSGRDLVIILTICHLHFFPSRCARPTGQCSQQEAAEV